MHFFTQSFHLITIPPLLTITLFFIIGIIWHASMTLFFGLLCITLASALFAYQQKKPLPKQLILCSFFAFTGAYLYQKELRDYHDFYEFTAHSPITINGTVIDKGTAVNHYKKSIVITLAINTITNKNNFYKSNKVLMIYVPT